MKTLEQLRDEKFRDPETAAQISSSSHYFAFCEGFAYRDELANDQLEKMTKALQVMREALNWYSSHDKEMTSEWAKSGIWRQAKKALADVEKILEGLK